jgi:hypothetical protein
VSLVPSTPASLGRLKILVCAQNEWYTQPIPCAVVGGPDTVITLGGFLFRSVGDPGVPDLEAFVKVKRSEVEDRIQRFLDAHPDVSALTKGRVVMDIEKPFPSGFHRQPPRMRARLARAFATRAEAARRKFPNAKLGFYATLLPDSRGRDTAEYLARIEALVKAGERGMFEEIDFLVPVIYPRFGPTDRADAWGSYEPYTRKAIEGSRKIRKSDGSSLPVLPFLTVSVSNKNSKHHNQILLDLPTADPLDVTLGVQLDVLLALRVRTAVFWVGQNSDLITRVNNPNGRTVSQHVCFRRPPRVPARSR